MKIIIKEVPIGYDSSLTNDVLVWLSANIVGLVLETTNYNSPWIRFGNKDLSLSEDNFYTVNLRDFILALDEKSQELGKHFFFCLSKEIKYVLIEKKFCKELPD